MHGFHGLPIGQSRGSAYYDAQIRKAIELLKAPEGKPRGGLPDLPRPLLWIEHRPARRRGPGKYFLHSFPSYQPKTVGAGFVRRVTLGTSRREPLTPPEAAILTKDV